MGEKEKVVSGKVAAIGGWFCSEKFPRGEPYHIIVGAPGAMGGKPRLMICQVEPA